jgi:hypothetical protein
MRVSAELTKVALAKLRELIDLPSLPHDDPNAASLREVKRKGRLTLRLWNAHYGASGPHEALRRTTAKEDTAIPTGNPAAGPGRGSRCSRS